MKINIDEEELILNLKNNIFIYNMNSFKLIKVNGKKSFEYLQNLITCDLNLIYHNNILLCSHNNYKGKVISTILIFLHNNKIFYISRSNIYKKHIYEIKKYDIRNEINFYSKHEYDFIGIIGKNSYKFLKNIFKNFNKNYNIYNYDNYTILSISKKILNRYIIISTCNNIKKIKNILKNKYKLLYIKDYLWNYFDIIDGYPIINKKNMFKFFPQEIGLNNKKSLSFNKGCYIGQEIISKIKFLNLRKKSLYIINIKHNNNIYKIDNIVIIIDNNYKSIGDILYYIIFNKKIIIQIVLPNNVDIKKLKIKKYNCKIISYSIF